MKVFTSAIVSAPLFAWHLRHFRKKMVTITPCILPQSPGVPSANACIWRFGCTDGGVEKCICLTVFTLTMFGCEAKHMGERLLLFVWHLRHFRKKMVTFALGVPSANASGSPFRFATLAPLLTIAATGVGLAKRASPDCVPQIAFVASRFSRWASRCAF